MLRWVKYLYWRFHADLKASVANKKAGPFAGLAVEMPEVKGKAVVDRLTRAGETIYEFSVNRRFKGDKDLHCGRMPMDWIYHNLFHDRDNPRWKEQDQPVLQFALGIFL